MMSEMGRINRPAHISAVIGRLLGDDKRNLASKVRRAGCRVGVRGGGRHTGTPSWLATPQPRASSPWPAVSTAPPPHTHKPVQVGKIRMLQDPDGQQEGGAFDCPPELAKILLERTEELEKRKVLLSQPANRPPEEDLYSLPRARYGDRGGDDAAFWEQRRQRQGRKHPGGPQQLPGESD